MSTNERIAIIDCQIAGVAGDMFLAALLDLPNINITLVIETIESKKSLCGSIKISRGAI